MSAAASKSVMKKVVNLLIGRPLMECQCLVDEVLLSDNTKIFRRIAQAGAADSWYMPSPLACRRDASAYVCALPLSLNCLLEFNTLSLNKENKYWSKKSNRDLSDASGVLEQCKG